MNYRLLFMLALVVSALQSVGQKDTASTGFVDQPVNLAKILDARHQYNVNNMRGALTLYREVLDSDPASATAMYGIAECHYALKKYSLALEYLDKAVAANAKVNSSTNFFYGQIHHRVGDLDKAKEYYNMFIQASKGNSYEKELAIKYIKQCDFAKEMMANPVPVTISNMGEVVNTRFEEYAPSITADGKLLIFTSRRSDTKGGEIDKKGDYKFFEDIYFSRYDESTGEWTDSESLYGSVNTETYDAVLSVAPDGSGIYVYKNTVTTTGDIYYSKHNQNEDTWLAATKMPKPINTSYFESSISQTADGNTLYFISERPEGYGQGDIYVSYKKGNGWSNPKNLGDIINTDEDEKFVFIHPNGKTLYFASNGHECLGSYDIFKTELVNGKWSIPVNLGYPINTVNEESTFSLTSDNTKLLLAAEYADNYGERDIYMVDISQYDLLSSGYDTGSFGQILVMATNKSNKPIKGIKVEVFNAAGKLMYAEETDRNGRVKVNLQGNQNYKVVFTDGDVVRERQVDLTLRKDMETVVKVEEQF